MYEKEVTQTEARIEKMKSDGKDEYDIKKMVGEIHRFIYIECLKIVLIIVRGIGRIQDDGTGLCETIVGRKWRPQTQDNG